MVINSWLLEVVVHRNAGGSVQHALRDIIILDEVLGLKEIAIVHHTDCGTLRFRDEDIRKSLKAKTDPKHWPEIDAMYLGAITEYVPQLPLIINCFWRLTMAIVSNKAFGMILNGSEQHLLYGRIWSKEHAGSFSTLNQD